MEQVQYIASDHAHDSHEWNVYKNKHLINIHYSPAINLQKHVHKCESHTRNAFINFHVNYQGNGLIVYA